MRTEMRAAVGLTAPTQHGGRARCGCAGRESPSVSLIALLEHNRSSIENCGYRKTNFFRVDGLAGDAA